MNDLNIEKFNPLKAEITSLVESIKNTIISMPGDKTGYDLMKDNKKTLQKRRIELTAMFKDERAGAVAYQKGIIAIEKDLLGIIEPLESEIDSAIQKVDEAKQREERKAILPDRKEQLKSIELELTDDEILDMDEKQFAQFFVDKKMAYLEAKQRKIDEANAKIEADRLAKQHDAELAKAKKEAAAQATKDAEAKAEREKQVIIDENNRKEAARLAAEAQAKKNEEELIAKEKAEAEQFAKRKKYQQFRAEFGYSEESQDDFIEKKVGNKIILFKRVGEFNI